MNPKNVPGMPGMRSIAELRVTVAVAFTAQESAPIVVSDGDVAHFASDKRVALYPGGYFSVKVWGFHCFAFLVPSFSGTKAHAVWCQTLPLPL